MSIYRSNSVKFIIENHAKFKIKQGNFTIESSSITPGQDKNGYYSNNIADDLRTQDFYSSSDHNQIYFNDWTRSEFKSVDLEPYIIPPVLDKNSFYNNTILIALWQQAFDAIKNAKNIFIYGFSFPDTDYSIKFLFQSALKGRKDYKIYVVNTNHNIQDLENKYNYIFGKEYCNYECCVKNNQLEKLMEMIDEKN